MKKKKGQRVEKQKKQENLGHLVGGIFNLLLTAMRHSKGCSQQKMAPSSVVRRNSRVGNKTKRRHWSRSIVQGRERQSAGLRSAENPGAVSEKWNQGRKKVEFRPLSLAETRCQRPMEYDDRGNSPIGHQDEDVDEDEQIKPLKQEATSPTVQPTGMHTTQLSNQCVLLFLCFLFFFF